jgi:hypothetical protein
MKMTLFLRFDAFSPWFSGHPQLLDQEEFYPENKTSLKKLA